MLKLPSRTYTLSSQIFYIIVKNLIVFVAARVEGQAAVNLTLIAITLLGRYRKGFFFSHSYRFQFKNNLAEQILLMTSKTGQKQESEKQGSESALI
jgi:hypothetical protein